MSASLGAGVHGAALAHELLAVHDAGVPAAGYAVLTDALLCAAWCAFLPVSYTHLTLPTKA